MPYIGVLDVCVVRVVGPVGVDGAAGDEVRVAVRGGFVEVKDSQVIMLADVAELASEVDVESARRDEAAASSGAGDHEIGETATDLRWAQVRLEAAGV